MSAKDQDTSDDFTILSEAKNESNVSNLFMPLQGQENIQRLREKFENNLNSPDTDVTSTSLGKISSWKSNYCEEWLSSAEKGRETHLRSGHTKLKQRKMEKSPAKILSNNSHKLTSKHKRLDSCESQHCDQRDQRLLLDSSTKPSSLDQNREMLARSSTKCEESSVLSGSYQIDNIWEGFSLQDTEKPKLSVSPQTAKVKFQLGFNVEIPASINQYLRDYQRDGIRFLYEHYSQNSGAILADDMGLGKTIQVIGFLSAVLGKQGNKLDTLKQIPEFIRKMSGDWPNGHQGNHCKPFLIIGPSSVLYNWLDELETWGYFIVRKFHGSDKESCLCDLKKGKLEIVVTTFETYRDNVDLLNQVKWEAVFVDEVHKIKGLKSQVTQALRLVNTPCRYGLTGTALQNNLIELWSLLDWAQPGVLGDLPEFEHNFIQVIEVGQRHDANKRELAQARKQKDRFAKLRKKLMLRRTKTIIADQLPKKDDMVVLCKLTDLQVTIYKAILTHPDMVTILHSDEPCDCKSGKPKASCCYKKSSDGSKIWSMVFSFMHLLLKAANHIALLLPDKKLSEKQTKLAKSVCEIAFKDHPQFIEQTSTASFRTLSDPRYCGKIKILHGLLSVFEQNHDKVLIFSYSTKLLDILEQYIISQGHEYRRIDGKVSSLCRRNIVVQFNRDANLFLCLISTKAGGLGLNMTAANRVVVFDPNWNPSHDLQAQDRAYRLGQCRDVQVFRLVSAGTIEENIYLRQIYKQQLDEVVMGTGNARRYFCGVQGSKENPGELFGIKNMLSLRPENSSLTLDIFKRTDRIEKGLAGYDISHYIPSKEEMFQSQQEDESHRSEEEASCDVSDQDGEDDEDESFYKNLFGSTEPASFSSPHQTLETKMKTNNSADEESDEEFNLIPNIHRSKLKTRIPDTISQHLSSTTSASEQKQTIDHHSSMPSHECQLTKNNESNETIDTHRAGQSVKGLIHNINRKHLKQSSNLKSTGKVNHKETLTGKSRKGKTYFTSVKSVLKMPGVIYTLKNNLVVGSSRAEDHMTRCAMEDVFEKHINTQVPADQCEPYTQPDVEEKGKKKLTRKSERKKKKISVGPNSKRTLHKDHTTIIVGQTPSAYRRQQWSMLCEARGVEPIELARQVIHSKLQSRLEILKEFYLQQHPDLSDILHETFTAACQDQDSTDSKTSDLTTKVLSSPNMAAKDSEIPTDITTYNSSLSSYGNIQHGHSSTTDVVLVTQDNQTSKKTKLRASKEKSLFNVSFQNRRHGMSTSKESHAQKACHSALLHNNSTNELQCTTNDITDHQANKYVTTNKLTSIKKNETLNKRRNFADILDEIFLCPETVSDVSKLKETHQTVGDICEEDTSPSPVDIMAEHSVRYNKGSSKRDKKVKQSYTYDTGEVKKRRSAESVDGIDNLEDFTFGTMQSSSLLFDGSDSLF